MAINEADILSQLDLGIARPDPIGDAVIIAIQSSSQAAINIAREILLKKGTGSLAQSIAILPIQREGDKYLFEIRADDYANFVDKGVNGLSQGWGSPYSFRSPKPSRSHVSAILRWIPSAGLTLNASHPQTKTYEQLAWAVASSIKQKGIKPTPFIDKAFGTQYEENLSDSLSVALGRAVEIKFHMIAKKHNQPNVPGPFNR